MVSYLLSPKHANAEKLSAYECGFEPFDEARKTFDVHFYVVAILFIIFDLEVVFLFP
jgi:NADH-quinone oxidoreductase subunit A